MEIDYKAYTHVTCHSFTNTKGINWNVIEQIKMSFVSLILRLIRNVPHHHFIGWGRWLLPLLSLSFSFSSSATSDDSFFFAIQMCVHDNICVCCMQNNICEGMSSVTRYFWENGFRSFSSIIYCWHFIHCINMYVYDLLTLMWVEWDRQRGTFLFPLLYYTPPPPPFHSLYPCHFHPFSTEILNILFNSPTIMENTKFQP